MKRLVDIVLAFIGLTVSSPVIIPVMILIWLQDFRNPLYIAPRVGLGGKVFRIVKLRSMVVGADRKGGDSTSADDVRITPLGRFIRRYKLDELTQLWNVVVGDMSLVGPRPNVQRATDQYTESERMLLSVRPGLTDFASVVFADEGDILKDRADPDLAYEQLIRPWKSRLGLFYVQRHSFWIDLSLICLTLLAIISRQTALGLVSKILMKIGADADLVRVALRRDVLVPLPPPGTTRVAAARESI